MKKIIYLLVLLFLLALGCGKDNLHSGDPIENIKDKDNSDNDETVNEGEDSTNPEADDTATGEDSTEENEESKVEEIPFDLQIELPEGTTVGEFMPSATVDGTTGWLLKNQEYAPQREYLDVQDELVFTTTACGWIENHPDDGSYLQDGGPVLNSELFVERKNGEDVKCGYFCEVTFRVFSMEAIREHTIRPEYRNVEYWCIVYKKEATEFTWIFLDKAFFTKEQAMAVTESLPATELKTTIKLKTGYSIQIDPIEGYTVNYNTEYPEGSPFSFKKNGEEKYIGLTRHSLEHMNKTYNELKEAENYSDWRIGMSDGNLLTYISGDVGISVYKREARIPMGAYESGDLSGYTDDYVIIWGNRNSSYVYYMSIDIGLGEEEVMKIVEAIHIEFEEP